MISGGENGGKLTKLRFLAGWWLSFSKNNPVIAKAVTGSLGLIIGPRQKNCELFWQGRLASSINTYGFAFSDLAGNAYEMKCRGFFFWRKIELYENGHLADEYYLYGSKRFDVHLNRRLLIVDANERYICSIQTAHEAVGDDWVALYHWECTEDDIQLQVISCLTLHLQGRGQPIGVI